VWWTITGVGQQAHPVRLAPVGRPHLPPVYHIVATLLHRPRLDTYMNGVMVYFFILLELHSGQTSRMKNNRGSILDVMK